MATYSFINNPRRNQQIVRGDQPNRYVKRGGDDVDGRLGNVSYIDFDTTVAYSGQAGRIGFDNTDNTLHLGTSAASNYLKMETVDGATYSTVQQMQDIYHSSGLATGGTINDAGSGNITVDAITGYIRATNDATDTLLAFNASALGSTAIPSDTVRYIGVEYNAGSPQIVVRTSYNWNFQTDFPLGNVVNTGGTLHIENSPHQVGDHAGLMIRRLYGTMPYRRDERVGGLILGETGTRNITLTAGTIWEKLNSYSISAKDTSVADTFETWYYNGSAWVQTSSVTQWNNTQYNNIASGLATMTNNWYANIYFYLETDGGLHAVYGQNQYATAGEAEDEAPPSLVPPKVTAHSFLIGRLQFRKSASTATAIESVYGTTFSTTSATNHNNLSGLQGGTINEYYHLTSAQATGDWSGYNILADKVSIGASDTMTVNGVSTTSSFAVHIDDSGNVAEAELHRHSATATRSATLYGARSRGSEATPTIVQSGDNLLDIIAVGYDGTDYAISSRIDMEVDGTPGLNDMPGRIVFKTSLDGGQTATEAFRIDSAQELHMLNDSKKFYWGAGNDVSISFNGTDAIFNIETTGEFKFTGGDLAVDTNVLYVDSTNNRVGINTTPSYALDVVGEIVASSDIVTAGDIYATDILNVANSVAIMSWNSITNNTYFDTDTLYIDVVNDRIGINTATPAYALDVVGIGQFSSDLVSGGSLYVDTWRNATNGATVATSTNASGDVTFSGDVTVTDDLIVDTNTFYVDSVNNRAGIGTTSLSNKFTVSGQAHPDIRLLSSSSAAYYTDIVQQYSATEPFYIQTNNYGRLLGWKTGLGGAAATPYVAGYYGLSLITGTAVSPTSSYVRMFITNTGDTGIGTGITAPSARLHVLKTTEQFRLAYDTSSYWTDTTASDGGRTIAGFGTDADLNFDFSGATDGDFSINTNHFFVDTSTADVGIGIAAPTAQLHIDQSSATGAQPVLLLDQADDSEEMVEFTATVGTGNAIEAVGAKTLTTTHFIKATITGVGTVYIPVGTIA